MYCHKLTVYVAILLPCCNLYQIVLHSVSHSPSPSLTLRVRSHSHFHHLYTPLITLHSHHPHLRNNYACTPPNPARPSNCCNTRISPANCLTRRSLHAPPTSRDPRETCDTLPRAHCTHNIDPSSCSHLCTGPTRRNALASVTYVGPSLGMPPLCSLTPSLSSRPLPPRAMPPPLVLLADRLDGGVPHGALSTSPL